jgi:hypothetical protein
MAEDDGISVRRESEATPTSALVVDGRNADDFDLRQAPRGAWFEETATGWRIGATTRSSGALIVMPLFCVWSGLSLGASYGRQIAEGKFDLGESLFGVPFLIGSVILACWVVMSICGKVVVTVDGDAGRVFAGVGRLGLFRRFAWSSIATVVEAKAYKKREIPSSGLVIALVGPIRITFGGMLEDSRRHYLLKGLQKLLAERNR